MRDFFKESLCHAKVDYCIKPNLADKEAQIGFPVMSHSVVSSKVKMHKKEICVLDSAQTHIVGHVKHVKILRNAAAYW